MLKTRFRPTKLLLARVDVWQQQQQQQQHYFIFKNNTKLKQVWFEPRKKIFIHSFCRKISIR